LLFLAVGVTLIAHSLWVRVTTRLSPSTTSILYYGNIPLAILLGVLVLHEPLTTRTMTGAALIIAGGLIGLIGNDER
jgi:drug/metabolite transporter (DMT)-like permease